MKSSVIILWILRLLAAGLMLQTLYFKFSGHEQSVKLFTILGMEPWGRIGTGVFELIAAILILIPRTTGIGAIIGVGLMSGAIFFHIANPAVGIKFDGDYVLFVYALIVFFSCLVLAVYYRSQIIQLVSPKAKQI